MVDKNNRRGRRAVRRKHEGRWQSKRYGYYKEWSGLKENKAKYGSLKDGHFSCGCWLCKPWKPLKWMKHSDWVRFEAGQKEIEEATGQTPAYRGRPGG